jgi:hypothetical protein
VGCPSFRVIILTPSFAHCHRSIWAWLDDWVGHILIWFTCTWHMPLHWLTGMLSKWHVNHPLFIWLISWHTWSMIRPLWKTSQVYCGFQHFCESASKITYNHQAAGCLATAQCGYVAQHGSHARHMHVDLVIPESLGKSSFLSPLLVKNPQHWKCQSSLFAIKSQFHLKKNVNESQCHSKTNIYILGSFCSLLQSIISYVGSIPQSSSHNTHQHLDWMLLTFAARYFWPQMCLPYGN